MITINMNCSCWEMGLWGMMQWWGGSVSVEFPKFGIVGKMFWRRLIHKEVFKWISKFDWRSNSIGRWLKKHGLGEWPNMGFFHAPPPAEPHIPPIHSILAFFTINTLRRYNHINVIPIHTFFGDFFFFSHLNSTHFSHPKNTIFLLHKTPFSVDKWANNRILKISQMICPN